MGKRLSSLLAAAAVFFVAMLLVVRLATPAVAEKDRSKADVILIGCDIGSSGFTVGAYSASSGAPAKTADNCAEMISKLNRDGFDGDIIPLDTSPRYVVIMLSR